MHMYTQVASAHIAGSSSRQPSYRLGALDPSTLASLTIDPLDAPCFTLRVPCQGHTFTSLLTDPGFQDGAIWGYSSCQLVDYLETYPIPSPAAVANWIWNSLVIDLRTPSCTRPWLVGFLLGSLADLSETEETLALVGLAHLCVLLPLVPDRPCPLLHFELDEAAGCHLEAVDAYRAVVRSHREQGLDFFHASRVALAGGSLVPLHAQRSTPEASRQRVNAQGMTLDACPSTQKVGMA